MYLTYQPIDQESAFRGEMQQAVAAAMRDLYRREGYDLPWIGYFATGEDGETVGSCSFKSSPRDGRVEIAYFTFPHFEGKGIATRMAQHLVGIAKAANREVLVYAQTLPEKSASTTILGKLGFELIGTVKHPEDGDVWEWMLG